MYNLAQCSIWNERKNSLVKSYNTPSSLKNSGLFELTRLSDFDFVNLLTFRQFFLQFSRFYEESVPLLIPVNQSDRRLLTLDLRSIYLRWQCVRSLQIDCHAETRFGKRSLVEPRLLPLEPNWTDLSAVHARPTEPYRRRRIAAR